MLPMESLYERSDLLLPSINFEMIGDYYAQQPTDINAPHFLVRFLVTYPPCFLEINESFPIFATRPFIINLFQRADMSI